ncbi:MAG TPA: hypothetical protein VK668_16585 [Mucilaginibacter sp.]|nr:hypothetical protein [Mucilaginibacter sp.]
MQPEFITYQKFNDAALANALAEHLDDAGIEYYIEEESSGFDPSMVMSNSPIDYVVKIKGEDFEQVTQLIKEAESNNIEGIEDDYYLYEFTDEELMEILVKADEWSALDYVLAQKILAKRGKSLTEKDIVAIKQKRLETLKAPEPPQTTWIILGYIFAFLGGLLGLFIGWHLKSHKKTLPDGEKLYAYTERDRWHGKVIFYIAIVGVIGSFIYKIWPYINH